MKTLVPLALLLGACDRDPVKATEIGNPEMTARVSAGSGAPAWIGDAPSAVLRLTEARVFIGSADLSPCDGPDVSNVAGWVDLLEPEPFTWEFPAEWCGGALQVETASGAEWDVDGDLAAVFRGVDLRGRAFEIVDRRPGAAVVSVEDVDTVAAEEAGEAVLFEIDAAIWLEGVDLVRPADPDDVVRIDGDAGSPPSEGAVDQATGAWMDANANGVVDPDDPLLGPAGAPVPDRDGDGVRDSREEALGSDPDNPDSDGDTLLDGDEVFVVGTGATSPDTDGDGVDDATELANGTDPLEPETCCDNDGDGFNDTVDCDDTDPTIFPGAPDNPGDGVDSDCDGLD